MSSVGIYTAPASPLLKTARPHVVSILPRGEAIRNFVYSGALESLSKGAECTVLSVIPSQQLEALLCNGPYAVQPLHTPQERWVVRAMRDLLDLAHGRHLWSRAAQERWMLRDYEARTGQEKLKRLAKKALCYPFASKTGLEVLSALERSLSRTLRTTDEYLELYRRIRPNLVFNASHVHSRNAVQAVQAAAWLKIPTATFIFSWDNLTSQGRILPPYDYCFVWNEEIRRQLLDTYPRVCAERVIVTGTPQFDFHFRPEYYENRETFCRRVGADPARPLVLYSTGMANHMPGEHVIVERISDILLRLPERPQLLVRVYPKDLTGRFDLLRERRPDIIFPHIPWEPAFLTPKPEDLALLTNTLRHCAAGINIASTISLELCMMDKPAINVAYDPPGVDIRPVSFARYYEFDHYRPVVQSGAVQVAHSESELEAMLRQALTDPGRFAPQRSAFVRRMFGDTLDGRCAQRIAQRLLEIASVPQHAR